MVKVGTSFAERAERAAFEALLAKRVKAFHNEDIVEKEQSHTTRNTNLADQRRSALQEARRQQLAEAARQREEEAERAREARQQAAEQRETKTNQEQVRLWKRSIAADQRKKKAWKQAQKAAGDRVANWRARADAAQDYVSSLLTRRMQQMVREQAVATPHMLASRAKPSKSTSRALNQSLYRSAPRVMPPAMPPPQAGFLAPTGGEARSARALYDNNEDNEKLARMLEEADREAQKAQKLSFQEALNESFLLRNYKFGWVRWQATLKADARDRREQRKIKKHFNRQSQSSCFKFWRRSVLNGYAIRAATQITIRFLYRRNITRRWGDWRRMREKAERQRNAMRRTVNHMLNRKLATGWNAWAQVTAHASSTKEAMRRVLRYMFNVNLKRGWLAWYEMYTDCVWKMDALRRAARNIAHRQYFRGWSSWIVAWKASSAARHKLRSAWMRVFHRGLTQGWNSWIGWMKAMAQLEQDRETMYRVLQHMRRRSMSAGFVTWREGHADEQRAVELMRGALVRMMNRELSRGWEMWQQKAAALRANLTLIEGSLRYFQNQQLLSGWLPWVRMTDEWSAEGEQYRASQRFGRRFSLKMGIGRWATFRLAVREAKAQRQAERRRARLAGLPKRATWPELVEIHFKTCPEVRQARQRFDFEQELRWYVRRGEGERCKSPLTMPLAEEMQQEALNILGLGALPESLSALDAVVRRQILKAQGDDYKEFDRAIIQARTQDILSARKLLVSMGSLTT